jgi:hypothetical protein
VVKLKMFLNTAHMLGELSDEEQLLIAEEVNLTPVRVRPWLDGICAEVAAIFEEADRSPAGYRRPRYGDREDIAYDRNDEPVRVCAPNNPHDRYL